MSIIKNGKNIIGVYRGSTPISKIFKGDLSVYELNVVYNVTAVFNVTSTTEPTKIANGNEYAISGFTKMCVDDVRVPVTSGYTFDTLGEHTVQYKLTDETKFANAAFSNCTNLTSVIIGEGVKSTGYLTFDGCTNLRSVTLPDTVTKIGNGTFSSCRSLSSITIPHSVTSIINGAFNSCTSLTEVVIPSSVKELDAFVFENCTKLRTVTIENGLESIGDRCFRKCTNLTSFVIPPSVKEIGHNVFEYCTSLTEFTIPNTVTSLGEGVFANCSGLTRFDFPSSITTIRNYFFQVCTSLTSVTIPSSVTSIGWSSFRNCTSLTEIEIPSSITSISNCAFSGCTSLSSITCLATTAPTLGVSVFDNMPSTGTLIYPCDSDYNTWLEQLGWENTCTMTYDITATFNVQSTTAPTLLCYSGQTSAFTAMYVDGVQIDVTSGYTFDTLGEHTVNYMLADNTTIGDLTFYFCRSLTSVTIPSSVTRIGHNAFGGCSSLTSIVIPDSVTRIDNNAFYFCGSLTSVTIPSSVTSISPNAFDECYIHIDNFINNSSATGYPWSAAIYDKIQDDGLYINGTTAVKCRPNATNVTIPSSVTTIGDFAFENCSSLTSVTIPDSVTEIGDNAFFYCGSLTSVTIPDSVTEIGDNAFYSCGSLSSITCLATTAPTLGTDVFNSLPENGTLIYPCDSNYNTWLTQLGWEDTCNQDIPPEEELPEYDVTATFNVQSTTAPTVLCHSGYTTAFTAMYVDGVQIDVTSGYTFDTLGEHAVNYMLADNTKLGGSTFAGLFQGCVRMTSIELPDTLTSIGMYVFKNCSSLTEIVIPNSVTSIDNNAFTNCTSLRKITIGSGVTTLGTAIIAAFAQPLFNGCTSLIEIVSLAPTAPTLTAKAFNGIQNNNGTLYVQQGADYSTWTAVLTSWNLEYI